MIWIPPPTPSPHPHPQLVHSGSVVTAMPEEDGSKLGGERPTRTTPRTTYSEGGGVETRDSSCDLGG